MKSAAVAVVASLLFTIVTVVLYDSRFPSAPFTTSEISVVAGAYFVVAYVALWLYRRLAAKKGQP